MLAEKVQQARMVTGGPSKTKPHSWHHTSRRRWKKIVAVSSLPVSVTRLLFSPIPTLDSENRSLHRHSVCLCLAMCTFSFLGHSWTRPLRMSMSSRLLHVCGHSVFHLHTTIRLAKSCCWLCILIGMKTLEGKGRIPKLGCLETKLIILQVLQDSECESLF